MRLAAYCRVSTEKESQLESLENQKLFFEEYAKLNNYQLVKIYADEGISGKQTKNRKEFLNLLCDAEKHEFEIVAVKDISRFARNTVDFLTAVRKLKSDNIEVVFLSNNQSVLGSSEFILTIFSALAQEESANLSKRVKFGKKVNAKKGRVPNCIYGYTQIDTFNMTIEPDEACIVKEIFNMYANTGFGFRRIAAELNQKGIYTKKHCCWNAKTIKRILTNPIYTGQLQNNKTEITDFLTGKRAALNKDQYLTHQRPQYKIIDDETYDKVGQLISKRQRQTAKTKNRFSGIYSLSSLIKCSDCGSTFTARKYTYKNTFVKWRCGTKSPTDTVTCSNKISVDQAELLNYINNYIANVIGDEKVFAQSVADEYFTQLKGIFDTENASRIISRAEVSKQRYTRMFASGIISFEELKISTDRLNAEITDIKSKLENNSDKNGLLRADVINDALCLLNLYYWTNTELALLIKNINVTKNGDVNILFNDI